MKLPGIHISIPFIFILWCVGAYLAGMTPLLLYPAMWAGVGLVFVILGVFLKARPVEATKPSKGA